MKSGLGRITENTEQYQGVVIYNMADVPLVSTIVLYYRFLKLSYSDIATAVNLR